MVAIVLLPGMDGTGALFAKFVSALEDGLMPIVVSYPENEPLGYLELEAFVRTQLPENKTFFLLGESFSGPIAISIAASPPASLVGLILCCSFARNPVPLFRFLKKILSILPITSKLTGLISPLLFGRYSSTELRDALRQALVRVSASTVRARLRAVLEVDFSSKLQIVQVPILYLQASEDRVVPSSAASHMLNLTSGIEIASLKGPHLLLQALPQEAALVVQEFTTDVMTAVSVTISKGELSATPLSL